MEPQAVIDEVLASNLRGRGGAFFADRPQGELHPEADATPKPIYLVINADESEPGTFKDREIMLRVPHRFLEGALITAHAIQAQERLHLHPRRVPRRVRGAARGARGDPRGRPARRRHRRDPPRRRRLHLRRGDGAARVARGQARPAALEAAVPGDLRRLRVADARQQRRDDRDRAPIIEMGGAEYAKIGADRLDRHAASSRSPATSSAAATTSSRTGRRCAS